MRGREEDSVVIRKRDIRDQGRTVLPYCRVGADPEGASGSDRTVAADSPETVQDLIASGLIRLGNLPRYGGLKVEYDAAFDVSWELGRMYGSTAWCYSLWTVHNGNTTQVSSRIINPGKQLDVHIRYEFLISQDGHAREFLRDYVADPWAHLCCSQQGVGHCEWRKVANLFTYPLQ
jgi:hypothetical protein